MGDDINDVSGPTANPVNTWTNLAVTYDGATLRLYVNGTQVATRATTGGESNAPPTRSGSAATATTTASKA